MSNGSYLIGKLGPLHVAAVTSSSADANAAAAMLKALKLDAAKMVALRAMATRRMELTSALCKAHPTAEAAIDRELNTIEQAIFDEILL